MQVNLMSITVKTKATAQTAQMATMAQTLIQPGARFTNAR
jgi:hypothetical protein